MNTNLVAVIKRIISEQEEAILFDPAWLKGFIADYAPQESKAERIAFGRCIEYGAYTELKTVPDTAVRNATKAAIARRVHTNETIDITMCNDALKATVFGAAAGPPQTAYPPAAGVPGPKPKAAPQTVQSQAPAQIAYSPVKRAVLFAIIATLQGLCFIAFLAVVFPIVFLVFPVALLLARVCLIKQRLPIIKAIIIFSFFMLSQLLICGLYGRCGGQIHPFFRWCLLFPVPVPDWSLAFCLLITPPGPVDGGGNNRRRDKRRNFHDIFEDSV